MATQTEVLQPKLLDPPAPKFRADRWEDDGKELMKQNKDVARRGSHIQWEIGDWLLEGDKGVQKKVLRSKEFKRKALKITKYKNWRVLLSLMKVCRRVPESRRRDGRDGRPFLDFSIHQEIAKKFEAEAIQESLLNEAAKGQVRKGGAPGESIRVPMSVRRLQAIITEKQEKGELPFTADHIKRKEKLKKKALAEGYTLVKILVPNDFYSRLSFLSGYGLTEGHFKERYETPARLFAFFASQYAKEHKAEIDAHVQAVREEHRKLEEEGARIVAERAARKAEEAEDIKQVGTPNDLEYTESRKPFGKAEQPTRVQFQGYTTRCNKLVREVLSKTGPGSGGLLLPYFRKIFGVKDISPETTSVPLWESTLAKLENASSPEALVEILKS